MALSFPLSLADFQDLLPIVDFRMSLDEPTTQARLGDGTIIRASRGEVLWRGDMALDVQSHAEARKVEALLSIASRAGSSVILSDPRYIVPANAASESAWESASATIKSISSDRTEASFESLPALTEFFAGDHVSFAYGTSPVRYTLHRLLESVAVVGGGTGLVQLDPPLATGINVGDAATFYRPRAKFKLTDVQMGSGRGLFTTGAELSFIQTMR